MTGNVDFESPVVRVLSRSVDRAEMGFPAVDRMITAIFQELDERSPDEGIVCSRNLTDAVIVPVRYVEQTVFAVGRLILLQRPVGDTVAGGIRPGDQAATRRGTDTAGLGLGEHDSLAGEAFHVGRLVDFVIMRLFCPERQGSVFPSHIVNHKEDDVRPLGRLVGCLHISCLESGQEY